MIDLAVLALVYLFLASFFDPWNMLTRTITTGGDTGSHYFTAVYLKEYLLPHGKIMGWLQGNYAGFPLFYHYFPLPFLFMALLSCIIPMQIAFKLVSVLGIFLLPICIYTTLRLLKYVFPVPILGAIFTLPFLFMEANSMWGANIPSTLAGEFSYGIGISLAFLFFGTLYSGIQNKNKIILNAFLVLLMGLSHGYSLIFSLIIGSFFVFSRKNFIVNIKYLTCVFGLGFLLLGFWLIPFIETLPWVTEYVTAWGINSIFEVFPRILLPFIIFSAGAIFLNIKDKRTWYFLYTIFICTILYFIGPKVGVLDIRFVPILQIFFTIFAATFILPFINNLRSKQLIPTIAFLAVILWVAFNLTFIKGWINWNYSGFEGKKPWPLYEQINTYLSKTGPGRVVYEHSPLHNQFGTERAFESLPFFAKRNTLEGLYMQSSPSSPFIFYIQSEISKVCSGPFPQYNYTSLNLANALKHLKMFNVTHYIVRTPEAKKQADSLPELKLEKQFAEYSIYRLINNDGHYVVPLKYAPVLLKTNNWKTDFYAWFKNNAINDVHLVYIKDPSKNDSNLFKYRTNDLKNIPAHPFSSFLTPAHPLITESLKEEEISFDTALIGQPHLIKISYHPGWQVEGADKIYLVSPSFMLVYPTQKHVRLYFGKNAYNYVGEGSTFIGLLILLFSGILSIKNVRQS